MDDVRGHAGSSPDFLVVGIGGSAGSIPAFREFFRNVPPDSGMAFVVVLHLSPDYESRLAEVLQSSARIPVDQVTDRVEVEPNRVYVIPPNKSLTLQDSVLLLSEVTRHEERRAPIDIFFRTLADTHESRAACVILSGTGADGSMGLRRVKEHNGLVLVQDPAEAEFSEMPRNSIATGLVDFVLPVADMPARVAAFRQQLRDINLLVEDERPRDDDEQALMEVLTTLRARTGQDFTNYKRPTVLRRIERRLALRELASLDAYALLVRHEAEEADALVRELLISVTNFFRDRAVWERVESTLIPKLLEGKGSHDHLRIWVPGCATGEEAYTVAMLLSDAANGMPSPPNIQIFATDLDEEAIAKARTGLYTAADVADVSADRLRRFFRPDREGYCIRRELRELVLFARHNLIKDPPFSHLDFVSCRNLLIYLNRTAQKRALEVLHFALEPAGYLLLGTAESVDSGSPLFAVADKESHIFQSRAVPRVVSDPRPVEVAVPGVPPAATGPAPPSRADNRLSRVAPIDLHQRLLEEYAAPSLIVDDQHTIVHLSDRAGKYLQFAVGEATLNVLQVIRPELRIALRTALSEAAQKRSAAAARPVELHTGDAVETIKMIVRPAFSQGDLTRGFFLIVFDRAQSSPEMTIRRTDASESAARHFEEELIRVKAQMRATIEQYELQTEEAKAANEELQAMNEELRSTAEELETSQEELQSVNEELQTVNQELKVKIDELSQANNDMRNLMSSTEIGTIFVDRSLRVKLFTPRARDVFNLIAMDVGRPLLDITSRLSMADLANDVDRVLDRLQTIEREIDTDEGTSYLMRMLPYRTADDRIDGVVITFVDITSRRRVEETLERRVMERTAELEALNAMRVRLFERLVTAEEEERKRISREIHDELGQHITALKIALEGLQTPDDSIQRMMSIVARLDESTDRLATELRPPVLDDLGLRGALAGLLDHFTRSSGVKADLHITGGDGERIAPATETALYRVVQEALTNASKHAAADNVSVIMDWHPDEIQLIIEDDGTGFNERDTTENRLHFGLLGMRERVALIGGTLSIESTSGTGTTIYVRIPNPGP